MVTSRMVSAIRRRAVCAALSKPCVDSRPAWLALAVLFVTAACLPSVLAVCDTAACSDPPATCLVWTWWAPADGAWVGDGSRVDETCALDAAPGNSGGGMGGDDAASMAPTGSAGNADTISPGLGQPGTQFVLPAATALPQAPPSTVGSEISPPEVAVKNTCERNCTAPPHVAASNPHLRRLGTWLQQLGVDMGRVQLAETAMGIGVVATAPIAKGERMFTIPNSARLSAAKVGKNMFGATLVAAVASLFADPVKTETAVLIGFLVYNEFYCEQQVCRDAGANESLCYTGEHAPEDTPFPPELLEQCPWLPYTRALPRSFDRSPNFYTDPVANDLLLRVPILDSLTDRLEEEVDMYLSHLSTTQFRAFPDVFGNATASQEIAWRRQVKWGYFILSSRAYAPRFNG